MKFFKPEDFQVALGEYGMGLQAANLANAKLEREGKVVYQYNKGPWSQTSLESFTGIKEQDHRALLINIEPIEKCTHPKEKVNEIYDGGYPIGEFQCECGAKVKPKEFEEV